MADADEQYRHFILSGFSTTEPFVSPGSGRPRRIPARDRSMHGTALLGQLERVAAERSEREAEEDADIDTALQIEFVGFDDVKLAFESLARDRQGIELLNVRPEGDVTYATVSVPDGKLAHFERLISDYLSERRDKSGRARDNRNLIDTISEIRTATLRALWTDEASLLPESADESIWWEVWLPVRRDRARVVRAFRALAGRHGITVPVGELTFPERTVLLAHGSRARFVTSANLLSVIAELRKAKETAEFFDSLTPEEQADWVEHLLERTEYAPLGTEVPYVCLLDTGVNRAHPLIEPALADLDLHTIEPGWGVNDQAGHGTSMAGLALLGNLAPLLEADARVHVNRRLESVKLLGRDGDNPGDPELHGLLTVEAVARPEIEAAERRRVFSLTVTARDGRDRGRPSAWSAAVDRLAADADEDGASPRLLVASAGNVADLNAWNEYPASNSSDGIHDPGQAWNALTVGSCTHLARITEQDAADYHPVAAPGGLSPFSTTSNTWQPHWPLKPDVLFEGGNAARDAYGAVWMSGLSLLTTHHRPADRHFTTANATSASTALAAGFAAELMAAYPDLWPETIRGLIVHSARWTDEMRRMYLPGESPKKAEFARLVRHCGFGMPGLDRAMWSVSNSLSMIVQELIRPFEREDGSEPRHREMHLHSLPWPYAELEALGETEVEMRVTLSYFIEPNPSARWSSRYRYESHGLRFDVKRAYESPAAFRARINRAVREDDGATSTSGDDANWCIGKNMRHRGSLHSDIWSGTAADLASRGMLAVYPAPGWWKTRRHLGKWTRSARYALIVSIHAPATTINLYTAVANVIQTRVPVKV